MVQPRDVDVDPGPAVGRTDHEAGASRRSQFAGRNPVPQGQREQRAGVVAGDDHASGGLAEEQHVGPQWIRQHRLQADALGPGDRALGQRDGEPAVRDVVRRDDATGGDALGQQRVQATLVIQIDDRRVPRLEPAPQRRRRM